MTCQQLEPRGDSRITLLRHTPLGVAWDAFRYPGKVAYKLWQAFASMFDDMSAALCRAHTEIDPRTTTELIGEWETALSLPHPCLPITGTIAERRDQILFRLDKKRWTTAQDWKDLAAFYGLEISVTPGWLYQKPALYPHSYRKRYDLFPKLGRFRVYVDVRNADFGGYPYDGTSKPDHKYPIPYGTSDARLTAFMCMIDRVRPANSIVLWNQYIEIPGLCIHDTFEDTFDETFC